MRTCAWLLSFPSPMASWLPPSSRALECAPSQGICSLRGRSSVGESRAGGHLGFEGDDFEHHLNSEEASEDHVEDIHGIVEGSSLLIVLGEKNQIRKEPEAQNSHPNQILPSLG